MSTGDELVERAARWRAAFEEALGLAEDVDEGRVEVVWRDPAPRPTAGR